VLSTLRSNTHTREGLLFLLIPRTGGSPAFQRSSDSDNTQCAVANSRTTHATYYQYGDYTQGIRPIYHVSLFFQTATQNTDFSTYIAKTSFQLHEHVQELFPLQFSYVITLSHFNFFLRLLLQIYLNRRLRDGCCSIDIDQAIRCFGIARLSTIKSFLYRVSSEMINVMGE
jgi:hypothetical protein